MVHTCHKCKLDVYSWRQIKSTKMKKRWKYHIYAPISDTLSRCMVWASRQCQPRQQWASWPMAHQKIQTYQMFLLKTKNDVSIHQWRLLICRPQWNASAVSTSCHSCVPWAPPWQLAILSASSSSPPPSLQPSTSTTSPIVNLHVTSCRF